MKIQNTFVGLDTDTSVNKYSNEKFIDNVNFRTILDNEGNNNALVNIRANEKVVEFTTGTINGIGEFFDKIVVFTTNNRGRTYIFAIPKDDIKNVRSRDLIRVTSTSNYSIFNTAKQFGFTEESILKIITRKETTHFQKIYFTDGTQPLRFINIIDPRLNEYDDNKFLISPNVVPGKATMDITSGNLRAGKVGYAYQLYNNYGAESKFIPVTELIDIFDSSLTEVRKVRGDSPETITNKGVHIKIRSLNYYKVTLVVNNSNGVSPLGEINGEKTNSAYIQSNTLVTVRFSLENNLTQFDSVTVNDSSRGFNTIPGGVEFTMPSRDTVVMITINTQYLRGWELPNLNDMELIGKMYNPDGEWTLPTFNDMEIIGNIYNPEGEWDLPTLNDMELIGQMYNPVGDWNLPTLTDMELISEL